MIPALAEDQEGLGVLPPISHRRQPCPRRSPKVEEVISVLRITGAIPSSRITKNMVNDGYSRLTRLVELGVSGGWTGRPNTFMDQPR